MSLLLRRKGLQFNLFEEIVYKFTQMRAFPLVKYVFELVFAVFFNYLFLVNLSDTSINTNITYANLIGAIPLQKRICISITTANWKQKETMWTTQVPVWMDVHSSPIIKFLRWQRWRMYISKRVFPTAVYSG